MTPPAHDEDLGRAAERTGLAWSRTLIALAAVTGVLGARAFLLEEPAVAVALPLGIAVALLLANGLVTQRAWRSSRASMLDGRHPVHARLTLTLAIASTALAVAMVVIVLDSVRHG